MGDDRFSHATYLIRRKVFTFLGAAFHVYGPSGDVLFYSKQKAFKLKEDIRVYTGEDMQAEVLTIKARQILDFSAAYDVVDARSGAKVGALKRKGWSSMIRDSWIYMDPSDREIGTIEEDSLGLALVRRFLFNLIPQAFHGAMGGQTVVTYKQNFNPFVHKITADFTHDRANRLDRRLGLAAGILLVAIEGRQQ